MGMGVCYSGIFQREIQDEDGAFPNQAFYLDLAMVRVHDGLYIAQAEAKSLDIM